MSDDPALDKARVLPAYLEEYAALTELIDSLSDDDWRRPTALPAWDVQAVISHLMGTELTLLGEKPPAGEVPDAHDRPHVHNDIAARNEAWVDSFAGDSPQQMRERWRDIVERRTAAMEAMTDGQWHAPSWTPIGEGTLSRFMRIRVFDLWLHEQDMRDAVGKVGHETGDAVDVALDEISLALGFLIGRKAGAPDGSSVTITLPDTGRTFHIVVAGRAAVVDQIDGEPTTVVRMPTSAFTRLAGGRGEVEPLLRDVLIAGDRELGERVARNLAFTI
ncbi:maleylpyruvate isomerase family mycothiol-dependent enzyme [Epidermidibacterium keratini]|uniref:maleylpyruvate isomerase family mycothiol-dependent enzyme n=1 Tax=Epidermidibacterium keratini TaxID=1891644 RepID=UPI001CEF7BA6|nr:maleylpyruvate isomerase family mycothiol-dependent enzyme [Epidermidibacterium keratini]